MAEVASPKSASDDRVDVIGPWRALVAHRTAIVLTAIACAVLGFAAGFVIIKNRADSFLQLSYTTPIAAIPEDKQQDKEAKDVRDGKDLRFRVNVAEYKLLSAAIFSRPLFIDYLTSTNSLDAATVGQLDLALAKDNQLTRWAKPVFAIARSDLREIPDQLRDEANYVVGMEFSVERRSADEALAICIALSNYARDSAILLRAREFTTSQLYKASSRLLDIDRLMAAARLQLAQAEGRQKELEAIRSRYPDAGRGETRQVISVDRTTSRYLPVATQLVGAESQIAEIHETLRALQWDMERSRALVAFLEPAQKAVRDFRTGEAMFPVMDKLLAATYDAKQLEADPWRDAYSTIKIELFGLKTLYYERMRFIATPALSELPLWLRLVPALAGLLIGLALAVTVVLVRERLAR